MEFEPYSKTTLLQRLERHIEPCPASGCWLWLGPIDNCGYGKMMIWYKRYFAHHIAWLIYKKTIPVGLEFDHLCRVRCCVNPAHLELVSHAENVKRGEPANKTHCKFGHEFTSINTYWLPKINGLKQRVCRICQRKRTKEWHARKENGNIL